jgi:hypothetical protein
MNLTKNGVTIQIADDEVVRMALERLNGSAYPVDLRGIAVPRIGEVWSGEGGVYAGIARGRDNAPDYHLIVGPEFDGTLDWERACVWPKSITVDGHSDFALWFRKEQSLSFANVGDLFKPEYYWSCEQCSSSYAYVQDFYGGYQDTCGKASTYRARAVRRLVIR